MSDEKDEVPAFLKGQQAQPTYRAAGGHLFEPSPENTSFLAGSRSKNTSPFPLDGGSNAFYEFGEADDSSYFQSKSIDNHLNVSKTKGGALDFANLTLSTTSVGATGNAAFFMNQSTHEMYNSDDESEVCTTENDIQSNLPSISFRTTSQSVDALGQLALALRQTAEYALDYRVQSKSQSVSVVLSGKCDRSFFTLRLYSTGENKVAEFQRQSGSHYLFNDAIKNTFKNLSTNAQLFGVEQHDRYSGAAAGMSALEAPQINVSVEAVDKDCIDLLVTMGSSAFEDVQKEALQTLTSLSQLAGAREKISAICQPTAGACSTLTQMLKDSLQSKSQEIRWLASCSTANLSESDYCAQAVELCPMLFNLLSGEPELADRDTQRQAQRALFLITSKHSELMMDKFSATEINDYVNILSARLS